MPTPLKRPPPPPRRTEALAAEAGILLSNARRLARVRDWLTQVLALPPTATEAEAGTVTLRRADLEAFRDGLGQAVSLFDRLTVDPTQISQPTEPDAAPDATTTGRSVQ